MKQRKPLEFGQKIQWQNDDGSHTQSIVVAQNGQRVVIDGGGWSIHRRQVTRVWRKKPKPVPGASAAREWDVHLGQDGKIYHQAAWGINEFKTTPIRVREILEEPGAE
jgi:hypothetical protein